MQNSLVKKNLVVAVIVLFVGVSVAPGIAAVDLKPCGLSKTSTFDKEIQNNELVEITVSICKTDGMENHTFMLTQQQATALDGLIENFKTELDNVETQEENIALYRDMVVSLDAAGLLPEEIGVEETQQLVAGNNYAMPEGMSFEYAQELATKRFQELFASTPVSEKENAFELDDNENALCLISGATSNTIFQGLSGHFVYVFWQSFMELLEKKFYDFPNLYFLLLDIIRAPVIWSILLTSLFLNINPLSLGYEIGLGFWTSPPFGFPTTFPAEGWVNTFGLNGKKIWEGEFFGQLPISSFISFLVFECYPGVLGFTGIKIGLLDSHFFYMGSALWVKIGTNPPKGSDNREEQTVMNTHTDVQNSQSSQLLQQMVQTTK